MAALELAQTTLADTPALSVPTKFLDGLVEKGYLTEENKDAILADEELCRFIKTTKKRARKTPAKKVSASDSERDSEEYDSLRCPCRIWKPIAGCGDVGLMNVQCSKKLPDGSTMCNMHTKKLDDDGNWWLGLVTKDPPAEPVFQPGKKKAHYWSIEAKEEAKEKKKSSKKTKKKVEDDEEEVEEKPKKEKVKKTKKVTKEEEEKEEEEEEDEDGNTPFVFEGVEYLRTEDGDIVDPENFDLMGEDDGQGGIDWSDEDMMKKHEEKKGK